MKTYKKNHRNNLALVLFIAISLSSCELTEDLPGVNETVLELEGEWSVEETSEIFKSTLVAYTVTISADPGNMNGVIIDDFYDVGISVKANVSGNSLTIPQQDAEDGYSVSGSGTITNNSNKINLEYVVNDGTTQDDHCTAVYTKL